MVTIEEEARKLFDQGKKPKEVYEILSGERIKVSLSTIENYYRLWKSGFKSQSEYLKDLAKRKGFKSWYEYQDWLAQRKGFKNYSEYHELIKDPNFKKICDSKGSDEINEDNPYSWMSRILEMGATSKDITETDEYIKLKEILENIEPTERLKYIGKLRGGVKILK